MNKLLYNYYPVSTLREEFVHKNPMGIFSDFLKSKGIIKHAYDFIYDKHMYEFDTKEDMTKFIMQYM